MQVNTPECSTCSREGTVASGAGRPTQEEVAGGAGRVELFMCPNCKATTRWSYYPAISDGFSAVVDVSWNVSIDHESIRNLVLWLTPHGASALALFKALRVSTNRFPAVHFSNPVPRVGFLATTTPACCCKPARGAAASGPIALCCVVEQWDWMPATLWTSQTMCWRSTTQMPWTDGSILTHVKPPMTNPCCTRYPYSLPTA